MRERLEEIKEKYNYERLGEFIDAKPISPYELKWLIQQAERVEELEKELNKQMNIGLKFEDEANELQKQNKRYREALEFYAERDNYQWEVSYRPQQEIDCMVIDDGGHTARKALEG